MSEDRKRKRDKKRKPVPDRIDEESEESHQQIAPKQKVGSKRYQEANDEDD